MGELVMKCPVCQSEGPEGKKYCAECGAELPQPQAPPEMQPIVAVSVAPKRTWCSTHLKGLFALAIVLVVVLASVGLIYTQPWSKIKVIISNQHYSDMETAVYVDGKLKALVSIDGQSNSIVGVWPVKAGTHTVSIDYGYWEPDGEMDYSYEYQVGPLYTKDVYINLQN